MGTLFRRARAGAKSNWIAEFTDHNGERKQKSTRTSDKKTAAQILAHWETEAAKRTSGLIDPRMERFAMQATKPITEHAKQFLASLKSAGRSEVHVDRTEKRLELIIEHQKWSRITDITPEGVDAFAESLRKIDRSNQTVAHYLQVAKQFGRYLSRTGKLPANPLETIQKPNPKSDRRRLRRMLLPAEWVWLRDAAGERAIIYELAIQTGLRSNELRSLHPSHVKHDAKPPHVLVRSGETKDSEIARQYITEPLAAKLAKIKPASKNAFFSLPEPEEMAEMLRTDLAKARATWMKRKGADEKTDPESDFLLPVNHADEGLDFHALRHTCGAWLAVKGVHIKTVQTIMRHKSITLTADTYGHLFPNAEPEAINKMASFLDASGIASTQEPS
jgi:integrase